MRRTVLCVLASAVLLTACGQPEVERAQGVNPVSVAAARAKTLKTVYMDMTMTSELSGQAFTATGTGGSSLRTKRGYFDMKADLPVTGSSPGAGNITTVYAGRIVYLRSGALQGLLPPGKSWIRMDLDKMEEGAGWGFAFGQMGDANPAEMLEYLEAVGDIEESGSAEVRGVPTTHYVGTIDLDRLVSEYPESAESVERMRQMGLESIPIEVWIDESGLPRRMLQTSAMKDQSQAGSTLGATTIEMEFFDYGKPVKVTIPPASKVVDAGDVFPR